MDDKEVIRNIRENTPLEQARVVLSGTIGKFEQAGMQQGKPLTPVQQRKMEYQAVERLIAKIHELNL